MLISALTSAVSQLVHRVTFGRKEMKLLMLGLGGTGKTTLLYKLKLEELVDTVPTIVFNLETLRYKGVYMTVWDLGGQTKLRRLWHSFFYRAEGLVFVVDSSNESIDLAQSELHIVLSDDRMSRLPLLVIANKQDLLDALNTSEVAEKLGLRSLETCNWHVQGACAVTGEGLHKGFDWLVSQRKKT